MGKKIITPEESDEDLILKSLMKGKKTDIEQPMPSEEELQVDSRESPFSIPIKDSHKKKQKEQSPEYIDLFIKESPEISRIGKTINIRSEFHERVLLITQMIGRNKISIFSYIDNILRTHLEDYQEVIDELLEESLKQKLPSKKR